MARGVASAALLLCCAPLVASQRLLALTYYAPPAACWEPDKGPPCAPKYDGTTLWDWWARQNRDPKSRKNEASETTGVKTYKSQDDFESDYGPDIASTDFSLADPDETPTPCACAQPGHCKWFVPLASRDLLDTEHDGQILAFTPDWDYPQYASTAPMQLRGGVSFAETDVGLTFAAASGVHRPISSGAQPGGCAAVLHDTLGAAPQCGPLRTAEDEKSIAEVEVCEEDLSKCEDRPGQPCLVLYEYAFQPLALPSERGALEQMRRRLRADYSIPTTNPNEPPGVDAGLGFPRAGANPFIGANFLLEGRCSFGPTATCDKACCEALAPPAHEIDAVLDEWRESMDHPSYLRRRAYEHEKTKK